MESDVDPKGDAGSLDDDGGDEGPLAERYDSFKDPVTSGDEGRGAAAVARRRGAAALRGR